MRQIPPLCARSAWRGTGGGTALNPNVVPRSAARRSAFDQVATELSKPWHAGALPRNPDLPGGLLSDPAPAVARSGATAEPDTPRCSPPCPRGWSTRAGKRSTGTPQGPHWRSAPGAAPHSVASWLGRGHVHRRCLSFCSLSDVLPIVLRLATGSRFATSYK